MITCTSTSPLSGADQAVTDGVHDLRFCSCTTRNGAEERGLSAHVVFRRRKKRTRAVSTCSRFFFSSPCTPTVTACSHTNAHLLKFKEVVKRRLRRKRMNFCCFEGSIRGLLIVVQSNKQIWFGITLPLKATNPPPCSTPSCHLLVVDFPAIGVSAFTEVR